MKRQELTREEFRLLTRNDFPFFCRQVFGVVNPETEYLHNWHIDLLSEYLEACRKRQIKRLIINIPPRSMKSIICSVAYPAWILGHEPQAKLLCATHSLGFAMRDSRYTRDVMLRNWYKDAFPTVEIADNQDTKSRFDTTKYGFRMITSPDSNITGEGADYIIIDDLLNAKFADSEVIRESANGFYQNTLYSRLNNKDIQHPKGGVIMAVMQRLHERDLTGYLLDKGGWEHLELPAEFSKDVYIDFGKLKYQIKAGAVLQPKRENKRVLEDIKANIGSRTYAGQYLQKPAAAEGGLIKEKWVQWYDLTEELIQKFEAIYFSWDTAIKAKQENDYTVCTVWGELDGKYYLIYMYRDKIEYPELVRQAKLLPLTYDPKQVLVEDKASGQQLLQSLRAETKQDIVAITPEKDKTYRLALVSVQFESGRVYFPKNKTWTEDIIHELKTFPNAEHDDIVDSITQFLIWIKNRQTIDVVTF